MLPIKFKGANFVFKAPPGQEEAIGNLEVLRTPISLISCWELDESELEEIIKTKKVWLGIIGQSQPPVWISGLKPPEVKVSETELPFLEYRWVTCSICNTKHLKGTVCPKCFNKGFIRK